MSLTATPAHPSDILPDSSWNSNAGSLITKQHDCVFLVCRRLCLPDERQQTHPRGPASQAVVPPPVPRQPGQARHLQDWEALEEWEVSEQFDVVWVVHLCCCKRGGRSPTVPDITYIQSPKQAPVSFWFSFSLFSICANVQGGEVCLRPPLLPSSWNAPFSVSTVLQEWVIPNAPLRDHPPGGGGGSVLCPRSLHLLQRWGHVQILSPLYGFIKGQSVFKDTCLLEKGNSTNQ